MGTRRLLLSFYRGRFPLPILKAFPGPNSSPLRGERISPRQPRRGCRSLVFSDRASEHPRPWGLSRGVKRHLGGFGHFPHPLGTCGGGDPNISAAQSGGQRGEVRGAESFCGAGGERARMRGWELVFLPLFEEVLCLFVVSFFSSFAFFFFFMLYFSLFFFSLRPPAGRGVCRDGRLSPRP